MKHKTDVATGPIPSKADVARFRREAGLTQAEAAALVHVTPRTWQAWEYGENTMPFGLWELFLLKLSALAGKESAMPEGYRVMPAAPVSPEATAMIRKRLDGLADEMVEMRSRQTSGSRSRGLFVLEEVV
jgi:DNA-binding transcriptional regulator YiaG